MVLTAAGKKRLREMKNEPAPREGWNETRLENAESRRSKKGSNAREIHIHVH